MIPGTLSRRLVARFVRGGAAAGRFRRYIVTGLLGSAMIWGLAITYLIAAPKTYTASFTFILPGTGAGASVNLDNIGQASSESSSPYSTPDMSPTENYRQILLADRVLSAAARKVHLPVTAFPTPRIELAQQTKLIIVSVVARRPQLARDEAEALRTAFLTTLDALRSDEIRVRDAAADDSLAGYRASLDQARLRLLNQEIKTGLVSISQYDDMVMAIGHLRDQLRDVEVRLSQTTASIAQLTKVLGTTPEAANQAMLLRADPFFQTEVDQLAKDDAQIASMNGTLGNQDPQLFDLRAQRDSLQALLVARGAELTGRRKSVLRSPDLSPSDERARLFERLIGELADQSALAAMRATLAGQIIDSQQHVVSLAQDAAYLNDLTGAVQVAQAVFSSALARIGTTKADFYTSYPLVQTLEMPTVPIHPSSPVKMLALAGAFAGTFFLTLALVMTWLRTHLLQRILRSGLSTQPLREAGYGTSWGHST